MNGGQIRHSVLSFRRVNIYPISAPRCERLPRRVAPTEPELLDLSQNDSIQTRAAPAGPERLHSGQSWINIAILAPARARAVPSEQEWLHPGQTWIIRGKVASDSAKVAPTGPEQFQQGKSGYIRARVAHLAQSWSIRARGAPAWAKLAPSGPEWLHQDQSSPSKARVYIRTRAVPFGPEKLLLGQSGISGLEWPYISQNSFIRIRRLQQDQSGLLAGWLWPGWYQYIYVWSRWNYITRSQPIWVLLHVDNLIFSKTKMNQYIHSPSFFESFFIRRLVSLH
jgi:hypothetical protein